jgi:pimeloyl-ACP methyl ester carboxylesterase
LAAKTVSVVSADGTEIACEVAGSGPALILIHGTADDRLGFDRVAPLLAGRFTLYMMDRRGRGLSKDASSYAIAREADDVAALAQALAAGAGAPVNVFAHSYGALCLIGAARSSPHLGRLMFYEPPPGTPSNLVERMVERTEAGDLEASCACSSANCSTNRRT